MLMAVNPSTFLPQGGVSTGGQQALTAFVTIALLRSSVTLQSDTLVDTFRCLHQVGSVLGECLESYGR